MARKQTSIQLCSCARGAPMHVTDKKNKDTVLMLRRMKRRKMRKL